MLLVAFPPMKGEPGNLHMGSDPPGWSARVPLLLCSVKLFFVIGAVRGNSSHASFKEFWKDDMGGKDRFGHGAGRLPVMRVA